MVYVNLGTIYFDRESFEGPECFASMVRGPSRDMLRGIFYGESFSVGDRVAPEDIFCIAVVTCCCGFLIRVEFTYVLPCNASIWFHVPVDVEFPIWVHSYLHPYFFCSVLEVIFSEDCEVWHAESGSVLGFLDECDVYL